MYEIGNHLLICAGYSDPELHSHSAAHIMISLDEEIEIITKEEKKICKGVLLPTGMAHTADTDKNRVLVFLFDSTTSVANQIKELTILSDEVVDEIVKAYFCFEENDQSYFSYRKFIRCVYECTGIKMNENMAMDKRIEYALTYIQSNLQEPITCSDVANYISLSEGRFSHLFKEQVGMTFSAYLIYQRIIRTYTEIVKGKSITEASIESGFSSSSHFAETNKKLFCLSARTIKKDLNFYKIAEI